MQDIVSWGLRALNDQIAVSKSSVDAGSFRITQSIDQSVNMISTLTDGLTRFQMKSSLDMQQAIQYEWHDARELTSGTCRYSLGCC